MDNIYAICQNDFPILGNKYRQYNPRLCIYYYNVPEIISENEIKDYPEMSDINHCGLIFLKENMIK